jgi:DNA polymerase-3 subunit alpha
LTISSKIISITYIGEEETYDLEMESPNHNFVANEFISHNSHAVPYSMITYYCMWSKLNYPAEFICALLTCGTEDEDKKNEYIAEAFRLGIEIRPPKIGISDPALWIIRNGILYAPFTEIKGIGEKTAIAFQNIKEGQGFYESGKSKRKIPDKFMKILDEIKAYDDVPVRDEEAEHISEYLSISIMKGVTGRYAKLYNLLSDVVTDTEFIDLVTNREKDLISGNISDLFPKLMKPVKRFRNKDILECHDCEFRNECKSPVLPSIGDYNVMIIGECPNPKENEKGRGFIGDSGNIMWYELGLYGYLREDFFITNVNRCFPGRDNNRKLRTPTRKHVDKCRKWLDEEIRNIKPFIVLALGNANIKFFTDNDTGIMNKSGTTEWNERYGTYVCYCIHPASTIYTPENKELFKEGVKNFCEKIKKLGEIPF